MKRSLESLMACEPLYIDTYDWRFYAGGVDLNAAHSVKLQVLKPEDDKFPTIMLTASDGNATVHLRMAAYEFRKFNELCKRAWFKIERF